MSTLFRASRDVIIRTEKFDEAIDFYRSVMGLPLIHNSGSIVGFDAGALRLFVERGAEQGAVLEFLVPDVQAAKRALVKAGSFIEEENLALPRCYIRDPYGLVFNIGSDPS